MTSQKQNIKIQQRVCAVAVLLFVLKFVAWYYTQSVAILTDALESIVNVVSGFIGLYSAYLSAVPRDKNHPYGHGKVEFLSAASESILILFAGAYILYESLIQLKNPPQIQQLDLGIGLITFSAIVNFTVGFIAVKRGKQNQSLLLVATGRHLQSDTYTTLGILLGLFLIRLTGLYWIDNVTAMIFAVVIIVTGIRILRSSIAGIMDEADEKLLDEIVAYLNTNRNNNWIDLHNLRIIKYGSVLHLDCHLTLPWYFSVKEAHREVKNLEALIQNKYGNQVELFVHIDACEDFSCPICPMENCPHRKRKFQYKMDWTADRISNNQQHQL